MSHRFSFWQFRAVQSWSTGVPWESGRGPSDSSTRTPGKGLKQEIQGLGRELADREPKFALLTFTHEDGVALTNDAV
jgi:hypothetical protein